MLKSIEHLGNKFRIIDQTKLPQEEIYLEISNYQKMIEAIKKLEIRGAPALGLAATAAAYLGAVEFENNKDFYNRFNQCLTEIEMSRPTAVNLFFAVSQIRKKAERMYPQQIKKMINDFYEELSDYEKKSCENMAAKSKPIYENKNRVKILTHCNTGSLATFGEGTALAVIKKIARDIKTTVFVDETRPLLQGARLTMWELQREGIVSILITDNMAAHIIKSEKIDMIITGADRIALNGDSANKIGTFNLAVLANFFSIPFYIVAPETTIDRNIESGDKINIEERSHMEVQQFGKCQTAPENSSVRNPAFDVTPSKLITAIITDKGFYNYPFNFGSTFESIY